MKYVYLAEINVITYLLILLACPIISLSYKVGYDNKNNYIVI